MSKTLMLLGLCVMGSFATLQADETESSTLDTTNVVQEVAVNAATADANAKDKDDCGCKR